MIIPRAFAILALGLSVAACGDSDQQLAGKTEQQLKPCDLLTPTDIEQVTGQAMEAGVSKHGTACDYASAAKNQLEQPRYRWSVQLLRHSSGLDAEVQQYTDSMKAGLGADAAGYVSTTVEGTGDRALWETFAGIRQLVVFKADGAKATTVISLHPDGVGTEQQSLEYARALAARALKRL
jgi:hypothetical protein